MSYAVRVMYDWGEVLHLESSLGFIEDSGGTVVSNEDYEVFDIGASVRNGLFHGRAEYANGSNVLGMRD